MISRSTAVMFLVMSLAAVAASQIIIKARFMGAGLDLSSRDSFWVDTLSRILCDPAVWFCGGLLVFGALCWYLALIRLPLSFMLPVAGVLSPIVAIAAHYWLDEPLPPQKLAAICLIAVGVVWLGLQEV